MICKHKILLEPSTCEGCDEGWRKLNLDAKYNWKEARRIKETVLRYIEAHPGCTAQDLYSDEVMQLADISMYLALHDLVHSFDIRGPDPYAPGAGERHTDWVYHRRNIDIGGPEDLATR